MAADKPLPYGSLVLRVPGAAQVRVPRMLGRRGTGESSDLASGFAAVASQGATPIEAARRHRQTDGGSSRPRPAGVVARGDHLPAVRFLTVSWSRIGSQPRRLPSRRPD